LIDNKHRIEAAVLNITTEEQTRIRELYQRVLSVSAQSEFLVSGNPVQPSKLSPEQLDEMWREHRDNIASVVEGNLTSGMKRVAIAGAGRCDSFHLADLLTLANERGVEQIDLIDLNIDALKTALEAAQAKLPGSSLSVANGVSVLHVSPSCNCRAIGCDLTFMLPQLLDDLESDLAADLSTRVANGRDVSSAMAESTSDIIRRSLDGRKIIECDQRYDLVISDCLITQINSFFGVTAVAKWLPILRSNPAADLNLAIVVHEGMLTLDHLQTLFRLAKDDGRIVFVSDVIRIVGDQTPRPRFINRGVDASAILRSLRPDLTIEHLYPTWQWNRSQNETENVSAASLTNQRQDGV
jgi:hypothetical protein